MPHRRDGISVRIYMRGNRRVYQAEWTDPITGKQKTKGLGTDSKREAERAAGRLETELNAGLYRPDVKMTWAAFRDRHEKEAQAGRAKKTRDKYSACFNHVERIIRPRFVQSIGPSQISELAVVLRQEGLEDLTVRTTVGYLVASLRWAATMNIIYECPKFTPVPATEKSKGRPITEGEYRLMRNTVAAVVGVERAPAYRRLIDGLWLSGLRLKEACVLRWDRGPMRVDFSGKRPVFVIAGSADKARKARTFPISPEFARFLAKTPERERKGFVFDLPVERPDLYRDEQGNPVRNPRATPEWVSRVIDRIGKRAKIVVGSRKARPQPEYVPPPGFVPVRVRKKPPKVTPGVVDKYASAHDFRRAFGTRWAVKVMPAVLQALMRHKDIATTMKFYVGQEAERLADVLWATEDPEHQ